MRLIQIQQHAYTHSKYGCLVLIFIYAILIGSCKFKQFNQSDQDIEKHYQNKAVKPEFHTFLYGEKKLYYAEVNANKQLPLLLMIHGSPGAWYGYMKQLDDSILQDNFHMISIDRPGFNKSSGGKAEPSIELQAEMIAALLKEKKSNQRVILMGRSYGSPIAAVIAARHPERVDGLILISSAVDPKLEKYFLAGKLANKGCVFRGCIPTPMVTANDEKLVHAKELEKIKSYWKYIYQPVTILQALDDKIVYPQNGDYLDSVLIHSKHQYIKINTGGHLISYTKPDLVRIELLKLKNQILEKQ